MKLLTAYAVAVLSLSFGANAFAQSGAPGLTRAEVKAQLQQAQAQGLMPTPRGDYPPSEAIIARNREIYAIQHGTDRDDATRTAQTAPSAAQPAAN